MAYYGDAGTEWVALVPLELGSGDYGLHPPYIEVPAGSRLVSEGWNHGWGSDPGMEFRFRLEDGRSGILRHTNSFSVPRGWLAPAEPKEEPGLPSP